MDYENRIYEIVGAYSPQGSELNFGNYETQGCNSCYKKCGGNGCGR